MALTREEVLEALKECYDPEIPVNIVDLGLIYEIRIAPPSPELHHVEVDMTMTSPGCPSHVSISQQVQQRLQQMPQVSAATVNVVWNPPWTPDRLSAEARHKLGIDS